MKTKMYISCMLALMITAAAWAAEGPSSPQSKATASLNGTEADRFMKLNGLEYCKLRQAVYLCGICTAEC